MNGTPVKYWFTCEKNHSFNSKLSHISNGCWCPYCVNKNEAILFKFLQSIYPSTIPQFSPDFVGKRRYDFCIPEHNIIIELDGIQHFMQVSNWKSPEEAQINDKTKEKLANDNRFSIIRLLQEDVFNDIYNWQYELQHNITTLAQYVATNKTIKNIYMCKYDEYTTL